MSFGYSVGDFLGGANLAYKLWRLLATTQCPMTEHVQAMEELKSLEETFNRVGALSKDPAIRPDAMNGASQLALSANQLIRDFLERTKTAREKMSCPGTGNVITDTWRKMGWSIFKQDELKVLKEGLHEKMECIHLILQLASLKESLPQAEYQVSGDDSSKANTSGTTPPDREVKNGDTETLTTEGEMTEDRLSTDSVNNGRTKSVINKCKDLLKTHRGTEASSPLFTALMELVESYDPQLMRLRFKDAVGRKFSFPFHLCCTWAGMEELIRQAFLHVEVIGPQVADGRYDLIGPNGEIILPQVWENMIEPDWAITMHMWPLPEFTEAIDGSSFRKGGESEENELPSKDAATCQTDDETDHKSIASTKSGSLIYDSKSNRESFDSASGRKSSR